MREKNMKIIKTTIVLLASMLISGFMVIPAFALGLEGKLINLPDLSVSGQSEYKIVVPNFIEIKTVKEKLSATENNGEVRYQENTFIVMETPEKDSNGNYPFFEIVTTDKNAGFISSSVNISNYDGHGEDFYMAGYQKADFKNGKVMFSPSFKGGYDGSSFEKEVGGLKDASADAIYGIDLYVFNKAGNGLFEMRSNKLKFMFVNKGKASVSGQPTTSSVVVDGKNISFEAFNIGGNNYFKLRDIAIVVSGTDKQFEVGWDVALNAISLEPGKAYTPAGGELAISTKLESKEAVSTSSKIYLEGKEVQLTAYNIGDNNYFKLRDIAKAFNIGVTWDGKTNTVGIDTKIDYKDE
jgi:hypothetical protein